MQKWVVRAIKCIAAVGLVDMAALFAVDLFTPCADNPNPQAGLTYHLYAGVPQAYSCYTYSWSGRASAYLFDSWMILAAVEIVLVLVFRQLNPPPFPTFPPKFRG